MVDNDNVSSLEKILSDFSFNPQSHNILQCDIEGAEWNVMQRINIDLIARNFSQMIFEFTTVIQMIHKIHKSILRY